MRDQYQALRTWFLRLEKRERIILLGGGATLALILMYIVIIGPFLANKEAAQQRITQNTELLHWMRVQAAQVQRLRGTNHQTHAGGGNESLLATADRTARADELGEALKQIQPNAGGDAVRVRLEAASFDNVLRWLGSLQRNYAIRATEISVDQGQPDNTVDVNLTLKRGA